MKQLVVIVWWDSQDHNDAWVDSEAAEKFTDEVCEITSCGFLVRKTDKYVTIAGDWDPADKDYGRVTKIPVGMVKTIREVVLPGEPQTESI